MVDSGTETDAQVVAQTLKDRDSFAVLIARYEAKLLRYIRRLGVRSQEDREDILQDIFIKVYRNLRAFDPRLSFSSWIYRIAHNETMSWFRKRSARPEHTLVDDGESVLGLIAGSDDVEGAHVTQELQREVRIALEALPQKYRDIVLLRYFEEKSYEEIADILEMPLGTVATLVYRAKEKLKALVPEHVHI